MIKKIIYHLLHNLVINNLAILFKFENKLKNSNRMWSNYKIDINKSLQENVGFSHRPDVEESLIKAHNDLKNVCKKYLISNSTILDVGCGTGLYLKDIDDLGFNLHGIDLSSQMIDAAKNHLKGIQFHVGDIMTYKFNTKFDLIYSISVLEYISRNDISSHFKKLAELLNENGVIFIHYPHALNLRDTLYPDLDYIKYSPNVISKIASEFFIIIDHHHSYDSRVVSRYDAIVYPSLSGTFKNGYLLVAKKKDGLK